MEESDIYRTLGQLVRRHRERRSLKQETLGERVGLSRASIANIETGRQRIPLHHLFSLAAALGVEARELLPAMASDGTVSSGLEIMSSIKLSEHEEAIIAKVISAINPTDPSDHK